MSSVLRAIVVRDEDDRIIVAATPQDIRNFAAKPGQEVRVRPPRAEVRMRLGGQAAIGEPAEDVGRIDLDDYLYDRDGKRVAYVRRFTFHSEAIDVSTFAGGSAFVQGLMHTELDVVALPGVTPR
jgi:hypothetical protein